MSHFVVTLNSYGNTFDVGISFDDIDNAVVLLTVLHKFRTQSSHPGLGLTLDLTMLQNQSASTSGAGVSDRSGANPPNTPQNYSQDPPLPPLLSSPPDSPMIEASRRIARDYNNDNAGNNN